MMRLAALLLAVAAAATPKDKAPAEVKDPLSADTFSGLAFRALGPAVMSGRIADIAVSPRPATYFVAVASRRRVEDAPTGHHLHADLRRRRRSYSIGCVTIDPKNPLDVWVGTGENNSQRSVGYGDGVYKSTDGGKTWENVGLKDSEHIGKIVDRPARLERRLRRRAGPALGRARRPRPLQDDRRRQDLEARARDQRAHRRQRRLARPAQPRRALRGCLPAPAARLDADRRRSRERRSTSRPTPARPGRSSRTGLPKEDLGRIGLAVSPANPDVVYAMVEAADEKAAGSYRSTDAGASWERRGDYVSPGSRSTTRSSSPTRRTPDRVYSMDVVHEGHARTAGKTWKSVGETGQARGQPRALDRSRQHRPPAERLRRRALRELRPRRTWQFKRQPAGHAVLPRGGRQRDAVLQRLRRHAGQQHARRPVAHHAPRTASPTRTGS